MRSRDERGGPFGRQDLNLQPIGIVLEEIGLDLLDEHGIVGAAFIEPEHCRIAGDPGAFHGEFDPIADRHVLRLAHTEDVAGTYRLFQHDGSALIDNPHRPIGGYLERLVVTAILFGGLGHQADIGHRAHGRRVVRPVGTAVIDDNLVDAGIAAVGDDGKRVGFLAVGTPHAPGCADHGRHRRVDNDIARDMQVGDPPVRIDHRQGGTVGQLGIEGRSDLGTVG